MSDRKEARQLEIPSVELLEGELKRTQYNRRYRRTLRTTIFSLLLVAAAAGCFWLTDRGFARHVLNVVGMAVGQLALLGCCTWGLLLIDRLWAYALWLLLMVVACALLGLRAVRLPLLRLLPAVALAILAGVGLTGGCLMLCLPKTAFVPVVGVLIGHLLMAVPRSLSSMGKYSPGRFFLLASGASELESLMPSVRRTLRAAVLPLLGQVSSPVVVAMPLLFCGLLLSGSGAAVATLCTLLFWAAAFAASVLTTILMVWALWRGKKVLAEIIHSDIL